MNPHADAAVLGQTCPVQHQLLHFQAHATRVARVQLPPPQKHTSHNFMPAKPAPNPSPAFRLPASSSCITSLQPSSMHFNLQASTSSLQTFKHTLQPFTSTFRPRAFVLHDCNLHSTPHCCAPSPSILKLLLNTFNQENLQRCNRATGGQAYSCGSVHALAELLMHASMQAYMQMRAKATRRCAVCTCKGAAHAWHMLPGTAAPNRSCPSPAHRSKLQDQLHKQAPVQARCCAGSCCKLGLNCPGDSRKQPAAALQPGFCLRRLCLAKQPRSSLQQFAADHSAGERARSPAGLRLRLRLGSLAPSSRLGAAWTKHAA